MVTSTNIIWKQFLVCNANMLRGDLANELHLYQMSLRAKGTTDSGFLIISFLVHPKTVLLFHKTIPWQGPKALSHLGEFFCLVLLQWLGELLYFCHMFSSLWWRLGVKKHAKRENSSYCSQSKLFGKWVVFCCLMNC